MKNINKDYIYYIQNLFNETISKIKSTNNKVDQFKFLVEFIQKNSQCQHIIKEYYNFNYNKWNEPLSKTIENNCISFEEFQHQINLEVFFEKFFDDKKRIRPEFQELYENVFSFIQTLYNAILKKIGTIIKSFQGIDRIIRNIDLEYLKITEGYVKCLIMESYIDTTNVKASIISDFNGVTESLELIHHLEKLYPGEMNPNIVSFTINKFREEAVYIEITLETNTEFGLKTIKDRHNLDDIIDKYYNEDYYTLYYVPSKTIEEMAQNFVKHAKFFCEHYYPIKPFINSQ